MSRAAFLQKINASSAPGGPAAQSGSTAGRRNIVLNTLETIAPTIISPDLGSSDVSLQNREKKKLTGVQRLIIGLGWDASNNAAIDLDASVILFDRQGQYMESVYFGQKTDEKHSLFHTGDNRDGEGDGDDEQILVDMNEVPTEVFCLMVTITSYEGQTFDTVSSSYLRILDSTPGVMTPALNGKTKAKELFYYGLQASGSHTGLIVSRIYRVQNTWELQTLAIPATANCFNQLIPKMQEALKDLIPSIRIQSNLVVPVLQKGESLRLTAGMTEATLGLGWEPMDTSSAIDLDASCVMFNAQGEHVDQVYFGSNKFATVKGKKMMTSSCGNVLHSGDNRTGEGDGDDEQITVKLNTLPPHIITLVFIVNSYSKHTLNKLRGAYVRLFEIVNGREKEFCRYDISQFKNSASTAVIVATLSRRSGQWKMKAIGRECVGNYYAINVTEMEEEARKLV